MSGAIDTFIDTLTFSAHGLLPAIIQDHKNNQVLMLGYMNREAIRKTLAGPYVHFYSRSRKKPWMKGETSGHTQTVKEIFFDCDSDTLLIRVEQKGPACHENYRTCFYRQWENGKMTVIGRKMI